MFSCISVHILTYYFYVFIVKMGVGGSDGLSLRFILFLLHGLWGEIRLWVLPIRLCRVRLTQCSCVDAFVVDLVIHGCAFIGSTFFRMSTRWLPVILFVSHFKCPLYPIVYCMVCLWWPRRFIVSLRPTVCQYFTTFSESYLLSSSRRLHRLSANLTARAYIRVVMLTVFVMTLAICIICQLAALPPLVTSQAYIQVETSLNPNPV